ncbi:Equilibrative nucleoside transporter 1 [Zostera marina]|uniref:Equilibrative nucleoside transporter 1 n=1 Tax=Zostera marina TaxID=29655 RepID=A0A0K9NQE8_ZOSMR|nr:Equilibrative nucleoside transporter 1 [Zostera marina]
MNRGEIDGEEALLFENSPPPDTFHLAYIIYFTLGVGLLIPWNTFITAVDYFTYIYPSIPVDRVFTLAFIVVSIVFLLLIILIGQHSSAFLRINIGIGLMVLCLAIPLVVDRVLVNGKQGVYEGFYFTVLALAIGGVADAFGKGGLFGSVGELPKIYMIAVNSGGAASGVIISMLRIITKSIYPQNAYGLRKSANLYFVVSMAVSIICIFCYNLSHKIPIIRYYNEFNKKAIEIERAQKITSPAHSSASNWRSTLWKILHHVKFCGFGIFLVYTISLSIFLNLISEEPSSHYLKDWYSIIVITAYNLFDLVGRALPAIYTIQNQKIAVGASVARLLFFPVYLGFIHGPMFLRSEVSMIALSSAVGLSNGYLTSIIMMLATQSIDIQHAEMAGIAMIFFLSFGLLGGSTASWFFYLISSRR